MALPTQLQLITFTLIAYMNMSPLSSAQNSSSQRAPAQPAVKGYFESISPGPKGTFPVFGWACKVGSEEKLGIRLMGLTRNGQWRTLKETTADRASEDAVQRDCRVGNAVRADGQGFRFALTLSREDLDNISDLQIAALTNGQMVNIPKVPDWKVVLMGK